MVGKFNGAVCVNPKEFKRSIYIKMDAFFNKTINVNAPLELALEEVKSKMFKLFKEKDIHWFFRLYEPFPEWTPIYGWSALGRTIYNMVIKKEGVFSRKTED